MEFIVFKCKGFISLDFIESKAKTTPISTLGHYFLAAKFLQSSNRKPCPWYPCCPYSNEYKWSCSHLWWCVIWERSVTNKCSNVPGNEELNNPEETLQCRVWAAWSLETCLRCLTMSRGWRRMASLMTHYFSCLVTGSQARVNTF